IPLICDSIDANLAHRRALRKAGFSEPYQGANERHRLFSYLRFLLTRPSGTARPTSLPWRAPTQAQIDRAAPTLVALATFGPMTAEACQLLLDLGPRARAAAAPLSKAIQRLRPTDSDNSRLLRVLGAIQAIPPGHLPFLVSRLSTCSGPAS